MARFSADLFTFLFPHQNSAILRESLRADGRCFPPVAAIAAQALDFNQKCFYK